MLYIEPARVRMINVMNETRMSMKNGFVQKYKQNQSTKLPWRFNIEFYLSGQLNGSHSVLVEKSPNRQFGVQK